jgi:hypothetical protein
MISYKKIKDKATGLDSTTIITKIEDGITSYIPFDQKNTDYKKYQEWLALGNTPLASE